MVANDISRADAGFDSEFNAATLISRDSEEEVPLGTKSLLAERILDGAERLLELART